MTRAARLRHLFGAWRQTPPAPPPQLRVGAGDMPPTRGGRHGPARSAVRPPREAVSSALARAQVPAAQVAIRRRGQLLWSASAGAAPDDRFVLASSGKLITACVLLRLAEQGTLDLDATRSWPPSSRAARPTTRGRLAAPKLPAAQVAEAFRAALG